MNYLSNIFLAVLISALAVSTYYDSKGILRDSETGRIYRSHTAKKEFRKQQPCPGTGKTTGACPGYVIDHIKALYKGGPDTPANMQWQTIAEGKAKDKWE